MKLFHSTCPGKINIYPPAFRKTDTIHTSKGNLDTYECVGCMTVIRLEIKNDTSGN
jgi:hypothetical protein